MQNLASRHSWLLAATLAARTLAADTMYSVAAFSVPWTARLPGRSHSPHSASKPLREHARLDPSHRFMPFPFMVSAGVTALEITRAQPLRQSDGNSAPVLLSATDFSVQHISGDGSCLFNAIAASIGNQDGNRLRKLAALKLTHYQDDGLNEATVGQGIDRGTGLSITGYQRHMVRGASRGGQIDLALLSEAVQCSIEVYRRVGTGHFMRERVFGAHFEDTVRVVFDGSHYDALVQQSMQACMGGYQGASGSKLVNLLDDKWTKRRFGQVVQGFPAPKSKEEHTATVIWLHGLGDTGFGWAPVTETFRMPHIKFLFPTAPTEAVTLNMGMQMPSWFDIVGLSADDQEDTDGTLSSAAYLASLVQKEISEGIPPERIVIAGFSQGGAVAMAAGLMMMDQPVAGIMCLSTWMPSFVSPTDVGKASPLLMCHGDSDPVVLYSWGQGSYKRALSLGLTAEFKTYPGMEHSFCPEELNDVAQFLQKCLPRK